METRYEVREASAVTGTCKLVNLKTKESHTVKLDNWKWKNSFAAEISFTFRGRKFSLVADMKSNYPDYL